MLLVQTKVELLEIANTGTDVRHLIKGDGFTQCCATRQNSHQAKQGNRED
jgi:hypothetical protein